MENYSLQIAVIGNSSVGKSSIIERACKNKFDDRTSVTIGAAYGVYKLNTENCQIHFNIWDVAGQKRFRSLLPLYYKKACAVIIVYDITDRESYDIAKTLYYDVVNANILNPIIILVGNKCDLNNTRQIETNEAKAFIKDENIHFLEVSAKTSKNIINIFTTISENLDTSMQKEAKTAIKEMTSKYNCCNIL